MKADINIIDFDRLSMKLPYVVDDLPGGGSRLMQKAQGYVAAFASGIPTFRLTGMVSPQNVCLAAWFVALRRGQTALDFED